MTSRETDARWKLVPDDISDKAQELAAEFRGNVARKDYEAWGKDVLPLLDWLTFRAIGEAAAPQPPAQPCNYPDCKCPTETPCLQGKPAQPEYEMRESTREEMLRDWQQLGAKLSELPGMWHESDLTGGATDCGEAGHADGCCGNAECLPSAKRARELAALVSYLNKMAANSHSKAAEILSKAAALLEADAQRPAMKPLTLEQKVWVLTSEYNDYDQHGEYFEAVFSTKPTSEQIQKICGVTETGAAFILSGGGRQHAEYCWYNLEQHAAHNIKEQS